MPTDFIADYSASDCVNCGSGDADKGGQPKLLTRDEARRIAAIAKLPVKVVDNRAFWHTPVDYESSARQPSGDQTKRKMTDDKDKGCALFKRQ
jgi:hypothetical protein